MNRLTQELQDSLKAFRDQDDVIRTLLCRNKGSEGPAWATQYFEVLSELYDIKTAGKNGEEFNRARKMVYSLIRREIFNYVEKNYALDENGQVASRSTDAIIQRPANIQQQPRLLRTNPFLMAPMSNGIVPFPTTVRTAPVFTGAVGPGNTGPVNHHVNHHHNGADQESIEQISEKHDEILKVQKDILKEQKKITKEIGDLKLSHNELKATVHDALKKKEEAALRTNA